MALGRRIKRIVAADKTRYIGTALLVMLGSITFLIFSTVSRNLTTNLEQFSRSSRLDDAQVILKRPLAPDDAAALERRFGVEMEERRSIDCTLSGGVTLRLFDLTERVDTPAIVKGHSLQSDNQVLLNPAFAGAQKLEPGDKVRLDGRTFVVAGYMTLPDYIYPTRLEADIVTDLQHFGVGVVTRRAMDGLNPTGTRWLIRYHAAGAARIKSYLAREHGVALWMPISENSRYTMVKSEVASLKAIALPIPLAVFVLTCALVATVIWRMVKMEFTQIGTLSALGYTRGELMRHYLSLPLLIAGIGGAAAVGVSALATRPVLSFYIHFYNLPLNEVIFRPLDVILSLALPLCLLTLVNAMVIRRALRLSPIQLMRGFSPRTRVRRAAHLLKLSGAGFPMRFRVRESMRSMAKLLVLMAGVTGASMLLLLGFAAQNSFDYLVNRGFRGTFRYEYSYLLKTPRTEKPDDGEPYQIASCTTPSTQAGLAVYGLSPGTDMVSLIDDQGRTIGPGRNAISRPLADQLHVEAGDTIRLRHKLTDHEYRLKVDTIAEVYSGAFVFMPIHSFNRLFGYPAASYQGLFSQKRLSLNPAELLKEENQAETTRAFEAIIRPIRMVMYGIAILAFIIAMIVLSVITSLIIEENRGSISMLKVLGYTAREINGLVLKITNLPVILGYALSVPLLLASLRGVFDASFSELDMFVPVRLAGVDIAIGLALIYLVYFCARQLAKRKVLSVSMAEALKTQRE